MFNIPPLDVAARRGRQKRNLFFPLWRCRMPLFGYPPPNVAVKSVAVSPPLLKMSLVFLFFISIVFSPQLRAVLTQAKRQLLPDLVLEEDEKVGGMCRIACVRLCVFFAFLLERCVQAL